MLTGSGVILRQIIADTVLLHDETQGAYGKWIFPCDAIQYRPIFLYLKYAMILSVLHANTDMTENRAAKSLLPGPCGGGKEKAPDGKGLSLPRLQSSTVFYFIPAGGEESIGDALAHHEEAFPPNVRAPTRSRKRLFRLPRFSLSYPLSVFAIWNAQRNKAIIAYSIVYKE